MLTASEVVTSALSPVSSGPGAGRMRLEALGCGQLKTADSTMSLVPILAAAAAITLQEPAAAPPPEAVVLVMADDQGWGDVGLRDASLRTPHLDALLRDGVELRRFYAAAPVCSPTRASVLTGRHPARMGIDGANVGHLHAEELHLGEVLGAAGWRTGFFGKWHLGTLTRDVVDSNRGGRPKHDAHHAPPWEHGFDECFATEAKVPTFDPMVDPNSGDAYGTRYWTGPAAVVSPDDLVGDDSALIVARALEFIERCTAEGRPSLTVVWLHAPHEPVTRSPETLARLSLDPAAERDRYVACLADVDRQVGALRAALEARGRGVLWYCSDNGPEHGTGPGSTGGLRGRKRDLYEGGIRVPAALWWCGDAAVPLEHGRPLDRPACTVDVLPTVLGIASVDVSLPRLDGRSLFTTAAAQPYGFRTRRQRAWIDGVWKIHSNDRGASWTLHHLGQDPAEARDLATEEPERLGRMVDAFVAWERDVIADRAIPGPR